MHSLQGTVDAVCIPDVKPVREKQMHKQSSAFLWPGVAALMMSSITHALMIFNQVDEEVGQ